MVSGAPELATDILVPSECTETVDIVAIIFSTPENWPVCLVW